MSIRKLRVPPELPEGFFEFREALDATVLAYPLFGRPANVGAFHGAWAFEVIVWALRPVAELATFFRLVTGKPIEVDMYTMVIHGMAAGLTHLVRLCESKSPGPVSGLVPDVAIQGEAEVALRAVNELGEIHTALGDVEIGWRDCAVDGRTVRIPSRSPERFVRSIQRSLNLEAEQNRFLVRRGDPRELAMYERLRGLAAATAGWYEPAREQVKDVLDTLGEAWRKYSDSQVPPEFSVQGRFTVDAYRRTGAVLKAFALAQQAVTDFQVPRPRPEPIRRTAAEWAGLAADVSGVEVDAARESLEFLLHSGRRDLRDGGRAHAPIAHTPLFDCGDGTWVLVPTLAVWHDPELALRAIWKSRAPTDYSAKIAALNRTLAADAAAIFRAKGWRTVKERSIPGVGDVDAGAGIREDPLFISCECKVFIDDPLRGADDPEVWAQLERTIDALRDPETFARVLGPEGLTLGEVKGLVAIPGRAQSPIETGEEYALLGIRDLADFAEASNTPRELWARIKADERSSTVEVREIVQEIAGWTLISDGVLRAEVLREHDTGA